MGWAKAFKSSAHSSRISSLKCSILQYILTLLYVFINRIRET
jgi:hypothetical protein